MEIQEFNNHKKPRKLPDQVRDVMRLRHYAFRTERTYVSRIKRFILFHDKKHPKDMGEAKVEAFLTWLAVDKNVAKSTQGDLRDVHWVICGTNAEFIPVCVRDRHAVLVIRNAVLHVITE
jgi:hypothetical protein